MRSSLNNVFWHSLIGAQACFASGQGPARRYAKGFSPILGFEVESEPDFGALQAYCELGERFYCAGWIGAMPDGWQLEVESTMYRMVWASATPIGSSSDFQSRPLQAKDAEQAVALAALTKPGPFGIRTIELGEYFGCFEGERLIAMAGERSFPAPYREISGVCTHPDAQGRGLARQLMALLIQRQIARKEIPFLHVMCANTAAHDFYLRMGFRDDRETAVRVVRCGG